MKSFRLTKMVSPTGYASVAPWFVLVMMPLLLKGHPHHPTEAQQTKETTSTQADSAVDHPVSIERSHRGHLRDLLGRSGGWGETEEKERGTGGAAGEQAGRGSRATGVLTADRAEVGAANQLGFLDEDELKKLRIEMIKMQILKKLRMEQRPNITSAMPIKLPLPLANDGYMQDAHGHHHSPDEQPDEFYGKTKQVILLGTKVDNCPNSKPSACISFTPSQKLDPKSAKSAVMWVYRRRDPADAPTQNHTLVATELDTRYSQARGGKFLAAERTGQLNGWVKLDMTHAVRRWLYRPEGLHQVVISCKTCERESQQSPIETSGSFTPLLAIRTGSKSHRPKRDAPACNSASSHCCLELFDVSFVDIGWSDWILQPSGYQANFCRGSCNDIPTAVNVATTHHSSVMMSVSLRERDRARQRELAPCCTASRMSGTSLLYVDEDGTILKADLPSMKVEACGCA